MNLDGTTSQAHPLERLTQMTGRPWLAGLITMLAFTLLHLFGWDWIRVLTVVLPGGILLTLFYLWRRSLALNVLIHAIMLSPLLLLPLLAPYMETTVGCIGKQGLYPALTSPRRNH